MVARETLYIISDNGNLVEYLLEPCCECEPDKITDDTELRLKVTARYRWPLTRTHTNKEWSKVNINHYFSSSPGSYFSAGVTWYGLTQQLALLEQAKSYTGTDVPSQV